MTIDVLAVMIQRGFLDIKDDIKNEISSVRKEMDSRFNKVDRDISYIHNHLGLIEREIADIKEKLDKVVYRHELEALQARVEKLEKLLAAK